MSILCSGTEPEISIDAVLGKLFHYIGQTIEWYTVQDTEHGAAIVGKGGQI